MVKETFGRLDRLSQADAELRGPAAHRESRSDADQGGDRLTDPLALVESFSVAKEDIATPAEPSDLDVRELYRTAPPMEGERVATGLPVGTKAPDFTLPDKDGTPVSLEALRGRPVALVFYPLDWSPGCSVQLELYQQEYEEFADRGVELLGISVDSIYSHGAWAAVRGISYPLLSDFHPRGEVARKYRVWRDGDGFSERAIYLIDAEGIIRWVHVSPQLHHLPHFDDLVAALDLVASAPEEKSVEPERSVTT
ncbi:redoxin domain-containing protein [uncultured Aeromicrobium sp.]|uniref:redoxin domain-containing protein n=1 Tax=uncultured Aeromicrobium sp. TaxID=337820 RepID=UPI0025E21320|nr:redoxin domain-containing protein [uncultured Aeromicrobium sp.]